MSVAATESLDYEHFLDHQLKRTELRIKTIDVATALVRMLAAWLGFVLLIVALDHAIILSSGFRLSCLAIMVVGSVAYVSIGFGLPMVRQLNRFYAARTIERSSPQFKNSIINFLDLRRRPDQIASSVLLALEEKAISDLSKIRVEEHVNHDKLIRSSYVLAIAIVAICAGILFNALFHHRSLRDSIARALFPIAHVSAPTKTRLADITPGHDEKLSQIVAGSSIQFSAIAEGKEPNEVTLHYSVDGGQFWKEQDFDKPSSFLDPWNTELTRVDRSLTYYLTAEDCTTEVFRVTVIPAPMITNIHVTYDFPEYTGWKQQISNNGNIDGLEGTTITIEVETNKPVREGRMIFGRNKNRQESMKLVTGRDNALRHQFRLAQDSRYIIWFETSEGATNPHPPSYEIKVRNDLPPSVIIREPGSDLVDPPLPLNSIVPLKIEANDDFGIEQLMLNVVRGGDQLQRLDLTDGILRGSQFELTHILDLQELQLLAGQEITYWIEASDNRLPTGNPSSTPKFKIRVAAPATAEDRQKALESAEKEKEEQQQRQEEEQAQRELQKEQDSGKPGEQEKSPKEQDFSPEDQQALEQIQKHFDEQDQKNSEKQDQGSGDQNSNEENKSDDKSSDSNQKGADEGSEPNDQSDEMNKKDNGESADPGDPKEDKSKKQSEKGSDQDQDGDPNQDPQSNDNSKSNEDNSPKGSEESSQESDSGDKSTQQGKGQEEKPSGEKGSDASSGNPQESSSTSPNPEKQTGDETGDGDPSKGSEEKNSEPTKGSPKEGEENKSSGGASKDDGSMTGDKSQEKSEQKTSDPNADPNSKGESKDGKEQSEGSSKNPKDEGKGNETGENPGDNASNQKSNSKESNSKETTSPTGKEPQPGADPTSEKSEDKGGEPGNDPGSKSESNSKESGESSENPPEKGGSPNPDGKGDEPKNQSKEAGSPSGPADPKEKSEPGKENGGAKEGSNPKEGSSEKSEDSSQNLQSGSDSPSGSESNSSPNGKKGEPTGTEKPGSQNSKSSGPSGGGVKDTGERGPNDGGGPKAGEGTRSDSGNEEQAGQGDDATTKRNPSPTDLVLERLSNQIEKNEVAPELLKKLGWTQQQLEQFVKRFDGPGDASGDRKSPNDPRNKQSTISGKSAKQSIKSTRRTSSGSTQDDLGENIDISRQSAPPEFRELIDAYTSGDK